MERSRWALPALPSLPLSFGTARVSGAPERPQPTTRTISLVAPLCLSVYAPSGLNAVYLGRSQVRENLHIVLCCSPIGASFRNRCRMFPALVNCCTIDWFSEWPDEALLSVAQAEIEASNSVNGSSVAALFTLDNRKKPNR